jgi:hypothetical protein
MVGPPPYRTVAPSVAQPDTAKVAAKAKAAVRPAIRFFMVILFDGQKEFFLFP